MKMCKFRSTFLAATGAACLAAAVPAAAQTAAAVPVSSSDELQEVIVTATRRSENLQNVPMSVAVVSQAELQAQNLADTTDLRRLVPSLGFIPTSTVANTLFVVRGVGTQANGNGLEQSVGVNFDGVALGRSLGSIAQLVDIQRVEVLQGPQGMLFGKNASAGVMNIVSQVPKLGTTEGTARVSYGSLNFIQATGTVNLPLGETAAARISAWKYKHDGFGTEINTGQKFGDENNQGARLRLRLKPVDALDLNFIAEWNNHNQNPSVITLREFEPKNFTAANFGAQIQAWELAHGVVASPTNTTMHGAVDPYGYYDRGSTSAYTGQADYDIGGGTLSAVVSHRLISNDNPFDPWPTDNPYATNTVNRDLVHYDQVSAEVRYASPSQNRLRYVAGLYDFKMNLHETFLLSQTGTVPAPVNIYWNMNLTNQTYAAFGEATFDITPRFHLIGGVRESHDSDNGEMDRGFIGAAPTPTVPGFNTPGGTFGIFQTAASTKYDNTSWRGGLQFQVLPSAMLYATASRGYKGPGFAYGFSSTRVGLAQANNGIVKPEIATMYEAGLKSTWFDRRLTVNLAVFDETFNNFQTSLRVPGPVIAFVTQNAKQLKSDGANLDATWVVSPELQLMGNVAYDHARFTDYQNAACAPGVTGVGLPPAFPNCVNRQQNLDGYPLQDSPTWTTNLTARYERPLSPALHWYGQANDNYRTKVVFNTIADPHDVQGSVNLVNLSAGLKASNGRWNVSVYGNNVTNTHFVDRIANADSGAFYVQQMSYGDLRVYGAAVEMHF